MGIMVYSLLWVLQDFYHPPYFAGFGGHKPALHTKQLKFASLSGGGGVAGFGIAVIPKP